MRDIVDTYLATWNATTDERQKLIADHWAANVTYTDPLAEVSGHSELDALIGEVHRQFPGFVFTPTGTAEAHHRQVRFGWSLGPSGGEPLVIGFDVLITDGDGLISDVRGFLDKVPT